MSRPYSHVETEEAVAETPSSAAEIVDRLLRAAHRLRGRLNDHFAEFGLNDIRYTVLKIVQAAAPAGCSQTQLAERLGQSESSICTLVERMRHDGLLYRVQSEFDRRKRALMLTPQGRRVLEQIDSCHDQRMEGLLRQFDPEQRRSFSELLELLPS